MRTSIVVAAMFALGCGAAAREVTPRTPALTPAPALFASHGAVTLRSQSPRAQPPFYAELAADGTITGTRCSATRFTDDGVLEREGEVVATVLRDGAALTMSNGWRIDGSTLFASDDTRFTIASSTITPSDAELPSISVSAGTPDALALALFAALLVCDDVGP